MLGYGKMFGSLYRKTPCEKIIGKEGDQFWNKVWKGRSKKNDREGSLKVDTGWKSERSLAKPNGHLYQIE